MLKLIKKIFYIMVLGVLVFVITSVLFGGGIVREIGERIGLEFFDNLADKGDAIKYKVGSAVGHVEKIRDEREEKGREIHRKIKAFKSEHDDLLKGKDSQD